MPISSNYFSSILRSRFLKIIQTRDEDYQLVGATNLPVELLLQIFQWYLRIPSTGTPPKYPVVLYSKETATRPWELAQVCRYWRQIILDFPSFWTSIYIAFPHNNFLSLIKTWLDRARGRPLTICVLETNDIAKDHREPTWNLLSLLIRYSHTWKSIDFNFSTSIPPSLIHIPNNSSSSSSSSSLPLPILESVSFAISSYNRNISIDPNPIWQHFHSSPILRQIFWEFSPCPTILPHRNLQEIIWQFIVLDDLLKFLEYSPQLISIETEIISQQEVWPLVLPQPQNLNSIPSKPLKPLHHQHLESLILNYSNSTLPLKLYQNLTFPRLRQFCHGLVVDQDGTEDVHKAMLDMLTRSNCSLDIVDIQDFGMKENVLRDLINHSTLRNVTRIRLAVVIDEQFLRCLTFRPHLSLSLNRNGNGNGNRDENHTQTLVLPKLEGLFMYGGMKVGASLLSNMLMSRRHQLQNIEIIMEIGEDWDWNRRHEVNYSPDVFFHDELNNLPHIRIQNLRTSMDIICNHPLSFVN